MNPKTEEILEHNRKAWDWAALQRQRWSQPVDADKIERARNQDLDIILTPEKSIPPSWLSLLKHKRVLGLAASGGQQGPLLAAMGADVTILDLSSEQLKLDRECAEKFGLRIRTEEGDAADLSRFADSSFDAILNPVSNCFFPDLKPVWRECQRVLVPGGRILYGFINPVSYLFDFEKANQGIYHLKYLEPYADHKSLSEDEIKRFLYPEAPLEFGHSLTEQMGLLLREGFVIEDFYEDYWGGNNGLDKHFPSFIAVLARKKSA